MGMTAGMIDRKGMVLFLTEKLDADSIKVSERGGESMATKVFIYGKAG